MPNVVVGRPYGWYYHRGVFSAYIAGLQEGNHDQGA